MALLSLEYGAYVTYNIKLIRSFIIKNTLTADRINKYLLDYGSAVSNNANDWKYYLNLAGLRYVDANDLNSDPHIMMVSLDNLSYTVIDLTPITLEAKPETLRVLRLKGSVYTNLLLKYPGYEMLIDGIINPIPVADSINALDFQILSYDSSYIEENETNIIENLQQWIYKFSTRWNNPTFALTDTLYPAAFLGILIAQLVPTLLNFRLENCKTERVNRYHLWNYLGGYFELDKFKNSISTPVALFLYRNIESIVANLGKQETLDFLYTNLVKPSNLAFRMFQLVQSSDTRLANINSGNYTDAVNSVKVLSLPYENTNSDNVIEMTTRDMATRLLKSGIKNKDNLESEIKKLNTLPLSTVSQKINLGVIEVSSVKVGLRQLINEESEKIHNWFYAVANDKIKFNYSLDITSEDIMNKVLTPANVGILILTLATVISGKELTTINSVWAYDILVNPNLPESEIKGSTESKYHTNSYTLSTGNVVTLDKYDVLTASLTYQPNFYNLPGFLTYINAVIQNKIQHQLLICSEPTSMGKVQLTDMVRKYYSNYECVLSANPGYPLFFSKIGFDVRDFSRETNISILGDILTNYLGIGGNISSDVGLDNMINILNSLTSYLVTFIKGEDLQLAIPLNANGSTFSFTDI